MSFKDLSQSFGITENKEVHQLAYPGGGYTEGGIIKSLKSFHSKTKRVPPEKLEEVYFRDPITFNTVNKAVQMLSSTGDRIVYNNKKEEKIFTEFLGNLSKVGGDFTWDDLKNFIWHSEILFGPAWIELIWDEDDSEIVDLGKLDPKVMDYARDGQDRIILDDNQKPIGYTQELPFGVNTKDKGDQVPENFKKNLSLGGNKIFLLPKRVAYIPLFTLSDGYSCIGLVESSYKSIMRKLMIEEAGVNSAYQRWMNPLVAYVGDERHPPNNNLANKTLETMKQMKHDLYTTYPYYVKLESIETKHSSEALNDILKYLRENQSAGTGMPMPLATGAGEATNRSTLNNMQNLMEFTLNDIAQRTAANITKYIFRPIAESKELDSHPKLVPNKVNIDEIDDFAKRMNNYVKNGNLRPEDVRKRILEMEGIEPEEIEGTKDDEKTDDNQEDSTMNEDDSKENN